MSHAPLIRSVARLALGAGRCDDLKGTLDAVLFSSILPGASIGDVPPVVADALLCLHEDLGKGMDERVAATTAFEAIRRDGRAQALCAAEVALAGLEEAVARAEFTTADVERIASLPWSALVVPSSSGLASRVQSFRVQMDAVLHEVGEGFASRETPRPELRAAAVELASSLRSTIESVP